eukprot:6205497-Pleurochrysis_carterae.AAC.2
MAYPMSTSERSVGRRQRQRADLLHRMVDSEMSLVRAAAEGYAAFGTTRSGLRLVRSRENSILFAIFFMHKVYYQQ